eukprot:764151-Hanusia_phi.AAC.3
MTRGQATGKVLKNAPQYGRAIKETRREHHYPRSSHPSASLAYGRPTGRGESTATRMILARHRRSFLFAVRDLVPCSIKTIHSPT